MKNIVLCGGLGTRLWPLSRTLYPKQFQKIFNDLSLFQKTVLRNKNFCDSFLCIVNEDQRFLALQQLQEINMLSISKIISEPEGRNTAPAIAFAALRSDPDDILLITPSDHLIEKENYAAVLQRGKFLAQKGSIVTFGIKPDFPATGFGYIESANEDVLSFKEKPSHEVAKKFIEAKNYYWNSGIFCIKSSIFLQELTIFEPEILAKSKQAIEASSQLENNQLIIPLKQMQAIPSNSIDYAILEKTKKIKMVPSELCWSDLGSFDAINKLKQQEGFEDDEKKTLAVDSRNNFVISSTEQVISTIDIEDTIIINTEDALLIAKQGSSDKVKKVFEKVKLKNSDLTKVHKTAYRPWGSYTVLKDSDLYKVKQINVVPGGRLSLQKHFKRSEHWVIVKGTAKVTVGEEVSFLKENQSIYIPQEAIHRLENETTQEVILIETQIGSYLGEDDIVRLEDSYSRS